MTDSVIAALITVGGTASVAVVSILTQSVTTKAVIRAERRKALDLVRAESESRAHEKRAELVREDVAELLGMVDPQINATVDYTLVVRRVLRLQLLLDRSLPAEARLNGALNHVGLAAQRYVLQGRQGSDSDRLHEQKLLLEAQGALLDAAQPLLRVQSLVAGQNRGDAPPV